MSHPFQEVEAVIDYNGELEDLSGDLEMPPGLGKVTVYGGKFEVENKTRELRDVFRSVLAALSKFLKSVGVRRLSLSLKYLFASLQVGCHSWDQIWSSPGAPKRI